MVIGTAFAIGCGSVTSAEQDGGAGHGGRGAAGSGPAGGGGGAGVAGAGGGGSAGSGVAGAGGVTVGGASGGGVGRGGGGGGPIAGTGGGAVGRGGSAGTAGVAGRGGSGGSVNACARGTCPPLLIGDLTDMDTSGLPGFNAQAFRCKALAVCAATASCSYFATDTLGHRQSSEAAFMDGAEALPAPAKLMLQGGAASQCSTQSVTIAAGELLAITFDGGKKLTVYLPAFTGAGELTLYIASDGSTFRDAALTMPARLSPP